MEATAIAALALFAFYIGRRFECTLWRSTVHDGFNSLNRRSVCFRETHYYVLTAEEYATCVQQGLMFGEE